MFDSSFVSRYSRRSVGDYGCRHLIFFITFGLYAAGMLISIYTYTDEVNSMAIIIFTIIGFILSAGIVLKNRWQDSAINLYPLFWHITVAYCFGFLGTIYFLPLVGEQDDLSRFIGLLNISFAILMLGQLVDRKVFIVGLILNVILGNILYKYVVFYEHTTSAYAVLLKNNSINIITLVGVVVTMMLVLFCTGSSKPRASYLDTLLFVLSRELMHYTSNVVGVGKSHASIITMCVQSSKITKSEEEDQITMSMKKNIFYALEENLRALSDAHDRGQEIMRYRINALRGKINTDNFACYDVSNCMREALLSYENVSDLQYKLPVVHVKQNFMFFGSEKHFKQAIMHLLSYSYWRCQKEDEERHLWVEDNKIHYYYTGVAIKASELLDLFSYPSDPAAYLANAEGLGEVGILYYVRKVMEAFGGDVICRSNVKQGVRYTHFTLTFPKVKKNDKKRDSKSNIPAK